MTSSQEAAQVLANAKDSTQGLDPGGWHAPKPAALAGRIPHVTIDELIDRTFPRRDKTNAQRRPKRSAEHRPACADGYGANGRIARWTRTV